MSAPQVGIVGARRRRQGLGPYVVRHLLAAGADVPCVLGTSEETVEQARATLARDCGIEVHGYTDAAEFVGCEQLDAVAILSPAETHGEWLAIAADVGLATLCEKPLVWGGEDPAFEARRVVRAFAEGGLLLMENCQWPYTVPAFFQLHPELRGEKPERFEMLLQPASGGVNRIRDAMSHAFSLLQTLAPGEDAALRGARFAGTGPESAGLQIDFEWLTGDDVVQVTVCLSADKGRPRQAGWALNGRWARRVIRPADYALFFTCDARVVDLPDPVASLVADFVQRLGGDRAATTAAECRRILQRVEHMEWLARAYRRETR